MRAPKARSKKLRVFYRGTAYDVINFKFQGGTCPRLPPSGRLWLGVTCRVTRVGWDTWIIICSQLTRKLLIIDYTKAATNPKKLDPGPTGSYSDPLTHGTFFYQSKYTPICIMFLLKIGQFPTHGRIQRSVMGGWTFLAYSTVTEQYKMAAAGPMGGWRPLASLDPPLATYA